MDYYDKASQITELLEIDSKDVLDWNQVLAETTKPHPEQSETNSTIGIGTDGEVVNMDLWYYNEVEENGKTGFGLFSTDICNARYSGYKGEFIEGRIQGTIPQYIKRRDDNEFLPVVSLDSTFYHRKQLIEPPDIPSTVTNLARTFMECDNLREVPEIPEKVTNMRYTFYECNSIEKVSIILNSVTNMEKTFYKCSNLTGEITINSNLNSYNECFYDAGIDNYMKKNNNDDILYEVYPKILVLLKGSCPQLKEMTTYNVRIQAGGLESAVDHEGKTVDLDLWSVVENNDGYNLIDYKGEIIDGKIIGTVPEYIKKEGSEELIAITKMEMTFSRNEDLKIAPQLPTSLLDAMWAFAGCTNLEVAPTIPEKTQDLSYTFIGCSNLIQGPTIIPSSVNYMISAFAGCVNLTGRMEINAIIGTQRVGAPFYGVGENGKTLIITGTSNRLEKFKNEGGGPGIIIENES